MSDRPILFSAPMVSALMGGRKTQTRRILTKRNTYFDGDRWPNYLADDRFKWDAAWVDAGPSPAGNPGPYLKLPVIGIAMDPLHPDEKTVHRIYPVTQPGDRLWVREAWRAEHCFNDRAPRDIPPGSAVQFPADDPLSVWDARYRHARFMPRWASRLTLTVTAVQVQRLQDISRGDAMDEGCPFKNMAHEADPRAWFCNLWNDIHGPGAGAANPWVCALTFTVEHLTTTAAQAAKGETE